MKYLAYFAILFQLKSIQAEKINFADFSKMNIETALKKHGPGPKQSEEAHARKAKDSWYFLEPKKHYIIENLPSRDHPLFLAVGFVSHNEGAPRNQK